MTRTAAVRRLRPTTPWAGYAACAWALIFAAMSFYWAAGGDLGIETQAPSIRESAEARAPWFVALLWATGAAKVVGGLLALALVRPWGRLVPRWMLLVAGWGVGIGMTLYGGLGLIVDGLRAGGLLDRSDAAAVWWHLLLWDPWWWLGGLLLMAAAWQAQRGARGPQHAPRPSLDRSETQSRRSPEPRTPRPTPRRRPLR
jgi:hypothetical protein